MANIVIHLSQNPPTFTPGMYSVRVGETFEIEVHRSTALSTPEFRELPEGVSEINRIVVNPNVTTITMKVTSDARSGALTILAKRTGPQPQLVDEKTSSGWIEVMPAMG
ncbi:hypothetical protein [Hyalangium sp.]|uniref:hypothetical protein n=1 Tax=Hyalangium sp. TaxID=2028555 RepID=UPI002D32E99E|nr:hypothetical protein [Hyalangium sp.]HYI02312.1 hypothetical protein [Hyalangium sp.]